MSMRLLLLMLLFAPWPVYAQNWDTVVDDNSAGIIFVSVNIIDAANTVIATSWGTGFIVSDDKRFVLSNKHVVSPVLKPGQTVILTGHIGNQEGPSARLQLEELDQADDIALLRFLNVPSGASKKLTLDPNWVESSGAKVLTIGFPRVDRQAALTSRPADGIISNPDALHEGRFAVETSITAIPGNSGGPVFNSDGNVVGIFFARLRISDIGDPISNVSYYIPIRKSCGLFSRVGITCEGKKPMPEELAASACSAPLPMRRVESLSEFYDASEYGSIGVEIDGAYRIIDSNDCYSAQDIRQATLRFYFNNAVTEENAGDASYLGAVIVRTYPTEWRKGKKYLLGLYRNSSDPTKAHKWGQPIPATDLENLAASESRPATNFSLMLRQYAPEAPQVIDDLSELPDSIVKLNHRYSSKWLALLISPDQEVEHNYLVLGNPYMVRQDFMVDYEKMNIDDAKTVVIRYYLIKYDDSLSPSKEVQFTVGGANSAGCIYIKLFRSGDTASLFKEGRFDENFAALQVTDKFSCSKSPS